MMSQNSHWNGHPRENLHRHRRVHVETNEVNDRGIGLRDISASETRYRLRASPLLQIAGDIREDLFSFPGKHVIRLLEQRSGSLLAHGPPINVRLPERAACAAPRACPPFARAWR